MPDRWNSNAFPLFGCWVSQNTLFNLNTTHIGHAGSCQNRWKTFACFLEQVKGPVDLGYHTVDTIEFVITHRKRLLYYRADSKNAIISIAWKDDNSGHMGPMFWKGPCTYIWILKGTCGCSCNRHFYTGLLDRIYNASDPKDGKSNLFHIIWNAGKKNKKAPHNLTYSTFGTSIFHGHKGMQFQL